MPHGGDRRFGLMETHAMLILRHAGETPDITVYERPDITVREPHWQLADPSHVFGWVTVRWFLRPIFHHAQIKSMFSPLGIPRRGSTSCKA